MSAQDERTWGMLAHLSSLLGWVIPLANLIAPLAIYLSYKDKSKFVAFHALEELYFQLGLIVLAILFAILAFCLIGIPFLFALMILPIIFPIMAGIKANNGELYEYPVVGSMARQAIGI